MTEALIKAVAKALKDAPLSAAWSDQARAALAAIEASGTHVVAPVEATDAMKSEADCAIQRFEEDEDGLRIMGEDGARMCWGAMISARPKVMGV